MDQKLSRRSFMKTTAAATGAATVGATSTVHPRYSPIGRASAALPLVPIGAGLGAAAVGAWVADKIGGLIGDDRDYSGYTGGTALREEVEYGANQMEIAKEQLLSSLENTVEFSANAALPKGMSTVVESLNNGDDSTTANSKMQDTIDEYYSSIQKDLLTHWDTQWQQSKHHVEELINHADVDPNNFMDRYWTDSTGTGDYRNRVPEMFGLEDVYAGEGYSAESITLLNGETVTGIHTSYVTDSTWDYGYFFAPVADLVPTTNGNRETPSHIKITKTDGTTMQYMDCTRYNDIWKAIIVERDNVNAELSSFVSDTYAAYEAGEISLADYVDPITAYTEYSTEEDFAFAGAAANMLGIPRNDAPLDMYLHDSDVTVMASIYSKQAPDGGFAVGETYDPDTLSYPVFMRYEGVFEDENGDVVEEVDFVQLDQQFTIESASDSDGNTVDSVTVQDGPTYDPADVAALQEQLDQIHEEQMRMQEEAQSQTGGGGGFVGGGLFPNGVGHWARNNPGEAAVGGISGVAILKLIFAA